MVFAGKGVAELQAAGWIGMTVLPWMPRLDILGLYPTAETLAARVLEQEHIIYPRALRDFAIVMKQS